MKTERRTLRPRDIENQQRDGTRIAPGIWMDRDGGVHWSVPELLALVDLPDTPENRAAVFAIVRDVAQANGCERLIEQEPES